jgi:cytochrome b561
MSMNATPGAPQHYSSTAKWLHWLMALIILGMIPIGVIMGRMKEGPAQDQMFALHKSFGAVILGLAVLRLAWRLINGAPPPAATLTKFERIASGAVHHGLYLLIFIMPLLGWAGTSAYGAPLSVFGLFELPAILPKNEKLSEALFVGHFIGAVVMTLLVGAHIAGALMHGLIKRDGVLQRMLPRL